MSDAVRPRTRERRSSSSSSRKKKTVQQTPDRDPKWQQAIDDVVGAFLASELKECLRIGEDPMLDVKAPHMRMSVESHLEDAIVIWKKSHGENVCNGDRCRHYAILTVNSMRAATAGVVPSIAEFYMRLRLKVDRYLDTRS